MPFPLSLYLWLPWKIITWVTGKEQAQREIELQRKAAEDIIRAGKENGVEELEITMSDQAGIGLGGNVDGLPIQFHAGRQGKMTIKVKYK